MSDFDPKADGLNCYPEGEYEASIEKIEEGRSSKGTPMLTITLRAYRDSGDRTIKDYIPTLPSSRMLWKLRRLCQAVGRDDAWDTGSISKCAEAIMGARKNLTVDLAVESSDQYGDQNKVRAYKPLMRSSGGQAVLAPSVTGPTPLTDSDIPF